MKKKLLSILFLLAFIKLESQCVYPNQTMYLLTENLKSTFSNAGDLWGSIDTFSPSFYGVEYPKLTQTQIQNKDTGVTCLYTGFFNMSAMVQGIHKYSFTTFRRARNEKLLSPGPISLKTGKTDPLISSTFNKIWKISSSDIANFQNQLISNSLPLNTSSISNNILTWPAKGNKYYTNSSPIEDDLAPYNDLNKNGIYDPENGDFPKIKGDTSFFTVMNDYCSSSSLGVELHLMAYVVNGSLTKNTFFYDLEVIKKTENDANDFIFSLSIDPDLGNYTDDFVGCDSAHNLGFCYNGDSFDESSGSKKGYYKNLPVSACRLLNKKMTSFITPTDTITSNNTDLEIRNVMSGINKIGSPFYWGQNGKTGTVPTKFLFTGDPSKSNEWSMYSKKILKFDYSFYMNTEPTLLAYNTPQTFSFKASVYPSSTWPPHIKDSIIPQDELIVKVYDSINSCPLSISNVKITPDINNQSNGSIELTIKSRYTPISKWSSGEKNSPKITNKKAGTYSLKIYDGNCILDTSISIPPKSIILGISSTTSNDFKVYPIPAKNELNIDFNRSQLINSIVIQNLQGQVVRVEPIKSAISTYTLSIQDLPKGVYFLQVDGQDLNQVSKFTKE